MSEEGVLRRAPATPGLLISLSITQAARNQGMTVVLQPAGCINFLSKQKNKKFIKVAKENWLGGWVKKKKYNANVPKTCIQYQN